MARSFGRYSSPGDASQTSRKHIAIGDISDHSIEADRSVTGELERRLERALDVIACIATVAVRASHDDTAELAVDRIAASAIAAEVELECWLERNADAIAHYRAISRARVELEDAVGLHALRLGDKRAVAVALDALQALYTGDTL